MAKQLSLVRHAEAENRPHQPDKERKLTSAGVLQSLKVGQHLLEEKFLPDIIFCSNALRAKETALQLTRVMKFPAEKILFQDLLYEATLKSFFDFLTRTSDACSNILCVGHNPAISQLTTYLTGSDIGGLVPAGFVIIRFNVSSWSDVSEGTGDLVFYSNSDAVTQ